MIGPLFSTILQNKTPPAVQGRVFAAYGQMTMIFTPFSFLLTAALVDNVLEPAASRPGDGMGLLLAVVGVVIVVTTVLVYFRRDIRELE